MMDRVFRPRNLAMGTFLGTAFMGLMQVGESLTMNATMEAPDPAAEVLQALTKSEVMISDFEKVLDAKYLNGDFCGLADLPKLHP